MSRRRCGACPSCLHGSTCEHPIDDRRPVRLAIVMSDGTIEPVEIDMDDGRTLADLDVDDRSDRLEIVDALRVALGRFT